MLVASRFQGFRSWKFEPKVKNGADRAQPAASAGRLQLAPHDAAELAEDVHDFVRTFDFLGLPPSMLRHASGNSLSTLMLTVRWHPRRGIPRTTSRMP